MGAGGDCAGNGLLIDVAEIWHGEADVMQCRARLIERHAAADRRDMTRFVERLEARKALQRDKRVLCRYQRGGGVSRSYRSDTFVAVRRSQHERTHRSLIPRFFDIGGLEAKTARPIAPFGRRHSEGSSIQTEAEWQVPRSGSGSEWTRA